MQIFHFSDNPDIACFVPRPVRVPAVRQAGAEWLNGPLVWAIDADHAYLYLFPRDCPRIVIWPTAATTPADRAAWLGDAAGHPLAYIEQAWLTRVEDAVLYRYTLPAAGFVALDDAGMFVSRETVVPEAMQRLDSLPAALAEAGVELRALVSLLPLKPVWQSSLHASGIRLRNAAGWED